MDRDNDRDNDMWDRDNRDRDWEGDRERERDIDSRVSVLDRHDRDRGTGTERGRGSKHIGGIVGQACWTGIWTEKREVCRSWIGTEREIWPMVLRIALSYTLQKRRDHREEKTRHER